MMKSILDTDLYKASVSYAYWKKYPLSEGTFTFTDRNKEVYDEKFLEELKLEFQKFEYLKITDQELEWAIKKIDYIDPEYWNDFARNFRFEPSKINVWLDKDGHLQINVTDLMYRVTWYEIPILATVSEVRNKYRGYKADINTIISRLDEKIDYANRNQLMFSEFGTRRRFSTNTHEAICKELKEKCPTYCAGTSNMYFAYEFGMTPVGTFPHEWIQLHAAIFGNKRANYLMLQDWIDVYGGNLGTALTDLFSTKSFLHTLTMKQAKLLDGYRIDSGDNFRVANMIIRRLQSFGIDPKTKLIVFSNALDFPRYKEIVDAFRGRVKVSAGIGTNITNDPGIEGYVPANIVMKLSRCRVSKKDAWEPCIKISDDEGKHIGDPRDIEIAKYELHFGELDELNKAWME